MLVLLGTLLLTWLLMVAATLPLRWGDQPSPRNACARCGYDFLALPRAEVCPECGMGRYDEPPRRIRWGRTAAVLVVGFGPGAIVLVLWMAGVRNLDAPLRAVLDFGGESLSFPMVIGAIVMHAFICWAILGPHTRGRRERAVAGHVVGALAMVADVFALGAMMLSAVR